MTVRAEISSSPTGPGPANAGARPGLPRRGVVRLRALVLIRWAAVAGQLFTAAVVHW
jgi:two-component system sensor histidine kinase RegB